MGIGFAIGCVPPLLLLAYIWYLDRAEHEPVKLVVAVLVASALLGTAGAAFIESVVSTVMEGTGLIYVPVLGDFIFYFAGVALVEEFCKRTPVMAFVWNNREFNYRFDAVVYCVASAIGFAVAENLMYIGIYGADIALGRLIPVHTICGVFMGYYLGCAKVCEKGGNAQACKRYRMLSLAVPTVIHGAWDFLVSVQWEWCSVVALLGITALTVFAWRRLHLYAKYDAPLMRVPVGGSGSGSGAGPVQ